MKSILKSLILALLVFVLADPAIATSTRVNPMTGFGVHEFTLRPNTDAGYNSGIDVVYADLSGSSDGHLTRCFLHVEKVTIPQPHIQVTLHDYRGNYIETLCQVNVSDTMVWPSCVKLDKEKERVWFSYTRSPANDCLFSVEWDPTLDIYPLPPMTDADQEFRMDCNFEVEWSTDPNLWNDGAGPGQGGRAFFAGLNSNIWSDPFSIWVRTLENPPTTQQVIEIGGYSCGFAFDNNGNLWACSYVSGEINHVLMWTATQVDTAIDTSTLLLYDSHTLRIGLPDDGNGNSTGCSDVECDKDGNVYVSANAGSWDPVGGWEYTYSCVVTIPNNGVSPWPDQGDLSIIAEVFDTSNWDWFRGLAYDGESYLTDPVHIVADPTQQVMPDPESGNRLYIDMDFYTGAAPDQVVGIGVTADSDEDGVPDALDNAYLADNGPIQGPYDTSIVNPYGSQILGQQWDIDFDQYGNICDCDLDNNGMVALNDLSFLLTAWGAHSVPVNADFDCNSQVGINDLSIMLGANHWGTSSPWFD